MLYSSDLIICIVSCIPTSIYNNVHPLFFSPYHMYHVMYAYWYIQQCTCFILLTLSYVQCHVYLLVYTIMYILSSSHLIICTMSYIPTSIYNNVHALFPSSYHMYHVMYAFWYIQSCTCFVLLSLSNVPQHVCLLVYTIMFTLYSFHIIICSMSCITTSIYNSVHALLFSSYHMNHVMYAYWYKQ